MQKLAERKTRLQFETLVTENRRPITVLVEPWGLRLRLKGTRIGREITWQKVWQRAQGEFVLHPAWPRVRSSKSTRKGGE
jgi:hypothetical protein